MKQHIAIEKYLDWFVFFYQRYLPNVLQSLYEDSLSSCTESGSRDIFPNQLMAYDVTFSNTYHVLIGIPDLV